MCVVIDADTFSEIVDNDNKDFEALRQWIIKGGHKVIHGGSKYREQLRKHGKFLRYLRDLDSSGRVHKENDLEIDNCEAFLKGTFISARYNDHHIAAILFVSGCKVVSSHDRGLHELTKECCSPSGKSRISPIMPQLLLNKPKIYQEEAHKLLLRLRYVSNCCN